MKVLSISAKFNFNSLVKFVFILCILIVSNSANAQLYLDEDFESQFKPNTAVGPNAPGEPYYGDWTQTRLGTITSVPTASTTDGAKDWAQQKRVGGVWVSNTAPNSSYSPRGILPNTAKNGTGVAWFNDYYCAGPLTAGQNIRRLESPFINLSNAVTPMIRFSYALYSGSATLSLVASKNGGSTWENLGTYNSFGAGWKSIYVFVPAAYKVVSAQIAFVVTNGWGSHDLFLDDIRIAEPNYLSYCIDEPNPEISIIKSVTTPVCSGTPVTLTASSTDTHPFSGTLGFGSLTTTNSNLVGSNYSNPFSHYWGGHKAQYLIRAEELRASGLSTGNITSLAFDVASGNDTYNGFKIGLAQTNATQLGTGWTPGITNVYSGNVTISSGGIKVYNFSTPFAWDGFSNIVVQTCWSNQNTGGVPAKSTEIKYDNTSYTSTKYTRWNGLTPDNMCASDDDDGTLSMRPKMILAGVSNLTWSWDRNVISSDKFIVTPTETTKYMVRGTNLLTGCNDTAIIEVVVNKLPIVEVPNSSLEPICVGSSTTLTATTSSISAGTVGLGALTTFLSNHNEFESSNVSPYAHYWLGFKSQYLIRASELLSSGLVAGNLNSLAFDVTKGFQTFNDFRVSIAQTSATQLTTTFLTGLTNVFADTIAISTGGIKTYQFSTPFVWDGVSNIVVQTCWSNINWGGQQKLDACEVRYDNTSYASGAYKGYSLQTPDYVCAAATADGTKNMRPKMIFGQTSAVKNAGNLNWSWTPGSLSGNSVIVSPTQNTIYKVTGTNPVTGCSNSALIDLPVSEIPNIQASKSPTTSVCAGAPVTLTATKTDTDFMNGTVGLGALQTYYSNTMGMTMNLSPYSNFYDGFKAQYIIRASELTAKGIVAGNLKSLTFYVTKGNDTYHDFKIGLAQTSATSSSSTFTTGITNVFSGDVTITSGGTKTYNFSSPFAWDGVSNLIVQTCFANNGAGITPYSTEVNYDNTTFASTSYAGFDGQTSAFVCGANSANGVLSMRPQMNFSGTNSVIRSTGANWSWNPGELSGNAVIVSPTQTTTYTVTAIDSASGCSNTADVTVNVTSQAAPVIRGIVNVCNYVGTALPLTYSVVAEDNYLSYSWSVGSMVTIVSGQGTSTINVILEPGFASSPASKQISVTITSSCGILATSTFYLAAQLPQTAGQISGPTELCSYVGTESEATYQIAEVTSASSYMWTVPTGATIVGNSLGSSINVLYDNTFTGGYISVNAVNSCGTSGARSLVVKRTTPSTPGLIRGPKNVCMYLPSVSNPVGLTGVYSVTKSPNVNYLWNVPQGIVIESQSSTATENIITVSFNSTYNGGSISVSASSECGTSSQRVLNLAQLTPGSVGGILELSTGDCQDRTYVYNIASMPTNSVSLEWTVPAGATIISGQGTTSITVLFPNEAVSGQISAIGNNGCGNSNMPRTFSVKLDACGDQNTMVKGDVKANKLKEDATNLDVQIFPNPSSATFRLRATSSNVKELMQVRIVDNLGREFKKLHIKSGETISFGSDLKVGSYFVEVMQSKEKLVKKVLKF